MAGSYSNLTCTERVAKAHGRIPATRLLPAARAAGYAGSARNFRRLVAEAKQSWRRRHHRGRRRGRSASRASFANRML